MSGDERTLKPLTPKEAAFVKAFLETGNATEAYRRGYNSKGKDTTIWPNASRLLKKPNVAAAIERTRSKVIDKADNKVAAQVAEVYAESESECALSRAWIIRELMDNVAKAKKAEDFVASNKALELLGKTDEMRLFLERSESDNRHHHSAEPLSPFADHLADMLGHGAEGQAEKPLPN